MKESFDSVVGDRRRGGTAVLAFGGNALLPDPFHPEEQEGRAVDLAKAVLFMLERSRGLVLVHGNGPQVGMILLRVEATRDRLPPESLDMLVAETQGSVGYLLTRALHNALRQKGSEHAVTAILTQVVVDAGDPAFGQPTKPIGAYYTEEEARGLREARGWRLVEEQRGWRRVVASPRPLRVVEMDAIAAATRAGHVVIAGGGGGIPVRETGARLEGVEAVIDKDRTSSLLARSLDADTFVILTGVPHIARDFGTPRQARLAELTAREARAAIDRGSFPAGSMRPKVDAACAYVEASGRAALITDTASLEHAFRGREGTRIVP